MRIIDKTPLQDQNGEISILARIQGSLKYGLNWYAQMEAQKAVIAQLNRLLEKGFVLIRNFTLPNSEIVIPFILIGSGGIWVVSVTNVKGYFEAKGDQWNEVVGGRARPARVNILNRTSQLARTFQKYLDLQKFNLPVQVEPVLIASDPGAQIDSLRPAVRVIRSDAIKQFAASLLQTRPVIPVGTVYELADQIIDPSLRKLKEQPAAPADGEDQPPSRARAIFDASDQPGEFSPDDFGFAFEDEEAETSQPVVPPDQRELEAGLVPARPRGLFGMNTMQVSLLAVMMIVECCVLLGFAYLLFFQFQ
jgi:hypothetical protein